MTQDANVRSGGHAQDGAGDPDETRRPRAESASQGLKEALARLDEVPVAEHLARFEEVHERLQERLAGRTDGGSGGGEA